MYRKKTDDDIRCPLEYGIAALGGKWNSRIICLLNTFGEMRFSEIHSEMINITDGVLGNTLQGLIEREWISKRSIGDKKVYSVYSLTEKGKAVVPIYKEICKWAMEYYDASTPIVMRYCLKCEHYKKWRHD